MTNKITEDMAGCWLDSHYGWNNHPDVVRMARAYGFPEDAEHDKICDVYTMAHGGDIDPVDVYAYLQKRRIDALGLQVFIGEDDSEELMEEAKDLAECHVDAMLGQGGLVDRATEHLDSLAPEGMAFNWDCGDLSLLCLCQIEGTDENMVLMKTDKNQCERCERRYSK